MSKEVVQEQQPFDVAWKTIDGLKIRYATNGRGGEKVVLFSPWPESIFAFAPVWAGLTKRFEVLALDLPGFGRSDAREDLFAPQKMGEFIAKAIDAFGLTSVHAVGLDVGAPSALFAALARPELFRSLVVGAGASTHPLIVEGVLKSMIEAPVLPPLNAAEVVGGFLASIRGYSVPRFVRDDYLASYEGDRLTRSAALVRAYPKDLAALALRLTSIQVPVAIVVGRNDPYGLARDAAVLRERLPHARLDVLEAGHCVWEERAPEFEAILTRWVSGGFRESPAGSGARMARDLEQEARNKALVVEAFDALFNRRDFAAAERYWSPDYIQHSAGIGQGRDGLFALVGSVHRQYESALAVAEGDYVMVHGRFSGGGRPTRIVVDILRVDGGRLTEHWDVMQDEATRPSSKSGLPMFGNRFPDE